MRILLILVFALFGVLLPAQSGGKTPPPVSKGKVSKEKGKKTPPVSEEGSKETKQKKGKVEKTEKKKTEEEEEDLPAGADPADLKAMKSAQDMLKAEKKLAAMIKAGKIKGIDKVLPFEEIASWPYNDGLKGMPKALKKLDKKKVMMTGFMLPIDEVENIKEFLLVQSLWSCCYGQPPDINGTVRVVMTGKKRIDYKFDPIKIVGTFKISPTIEDGFCVDIYQLETSNVEVIK